MGILMWCPVGRNAWGPHGPPLWCPEPRWDGFCSNCLTAGFCLFQVSSFRVKTSLPLLTMTLTTTPPLNTASSVSLTRTYTNTHKHRHGAYLQVCLKVTPAVKTWTGSVNNLRTSPLPWQLLQKPQNGAGLMFTMLHHIQSFWWVHHKLS